MKKYYHIITEENDEYISTVAHAESVDAIKSYFAGKNICEIIELNKAQLNTSDTPTTTHIEIDNGLNNTLFLECRGCYFSENDSIRSVSDVGNYRVGIYKNRIIAKDGNAYILEFTGYDRKEMRYTSTQTGKLLKNPKYETVLKNALHVGTEFEKIEGGRALSFANVQLEKELHDKKTYLFTKADILRAANDISIKQYSKIVLLPDEKIVDLLPRIYKIGGYREKDILDNLSEVKTKQYDKYYHVYTFISGSGESFDFDEIGSRITG